MRTMIPRSCGRSSPSAMPRSIACSTSSSPRSATAFARSRGRCRRTNCFWHSRTSSRSRPRGWRARKRRTRPSARLGSARRTNRGSLPAYLPRIERLVDIADKTCPCCRGMLHVMGEDVSERLDIVPAQFRVIVTRRPKYALPRLRGGVVQAPAPPRLIEGDIPTEDTVAHVLVAIYADHLPLYRQAQIYARQGVPLDRSTLADWLGKAAFLLKPVHERCSSG